NGKWGWKGVGAYPIIKAKEARVIASGYLKEIEAGTFLEVDKYKLSSLIESLLDKKQKKWKPKTFSKMQLSIKKHIYPEFGNRDLRTIKTTE
ncbi:site-specific integrase, partial [Acinetobacter variabilis]